MYDRWRETERVRQKRVLTELLLLLLGKRKLLLRKYDGLLGVWGRCRLLLLLLSQQMLLLERNDTR